MKPKKLKYISSTNNINRRIKCLRASLTKWAILYTTNSGRTWGVYTSKTNGKRKTISFEG